MIIASKGAAGVTGAGLATLAGGLQSHRPDLVDGVGLIVGIDRFMSRGPRADQLRRQRRRHRPHRHWTKEIDRERMSRVLSGQKPFNEAALVDDHAASSSNEAGEAPTRV